MSLRPSTRTKPASARAPEAADDTAQPGDAPPDNGPASVGHRLRLERERQRIGLRELARRVKVSASLISQIELGRATPSVGTLYAIVNELGISLDELFFVAPARSAGGSAEHATEPRTGAVADSRPEAADHQEHAPASEAGPAADVAYEGPVVRPEVRHSIQLGSGVTWERMSPDTEHEVDFLYVVYDVGGASAPERSLMRHGGKEFGYLLEGRLGVTVGFKTYELEPGDAISFDSTTPHRLFNAGDVPARAIWCVVGRDDPRVTRHGASSAPD